MKTLIITCLTSLMILFNLLQKDPCILKVKVLDESKNPIISCQVKLYKDGKTKAVATTDFDGFVVFHLAPDTFDLEASYMCKVHKVVGLNFDCASDTIYEIAFSSGHFLEEIVVKECKAPLMVVENTTHALDVSKPFTPYTDYEENTEEYHHLGENKEHQASVTPLSTFSIDVDRASYSNIRRMINNNQQLPIDAVRIEEMINYFNYKYEKPDKKGHPVSIHTEIGICPWNKDKQLMLVGIQGREIEKENIPPSNLCFLLDVSGSMEDDNKLPLVKKTMLYLLDQLRAEDQISIVVYAGSAGLVLPPTSASKKNVIKEAIMNLEAGGSTAGGEGILLAYKLVKDHFFEHGNNRVIICTDGDFNVGLSGVSELEKLISEQSETGIYLSCLGFGMGNYKDNILETLADKGNGNYAYIDHFNEAIKVFGKEFAGTLFSIANDVKVQIEFNPQSVINYRLVGYENRILAAEDFKNDKVDAGEMGSGHSVTALYELTLHHSGKSTASGYLKYQNLITNQFPDELAQVSVRYKLPKSKTGIELSKTVSMRTGLFSCRALDLASAVAMFGMKLKESPHLKERGMEESLAKIKNCSNLYPDSEIDEFVRLVEKVLYKG